jgi:hypothetical protein
MICSLVAFDKKFLASFFHEAGHAVAAWSLGVPVFQMNLAAFGSSNGESGYRSVTFSHPSEGLLNQSTKDLRTWAIIMMAGLVAEAKILGKKEMDADDEKAWGRDLTIASDIIRRMPGGNIDFEKPFKGIYRATERIIKKNWSRVEMLVIGALKLGPVLSGSQVHELIECGELSEIELVDKFPSPCQAH